MAHQDGHGDSHAEHNPIAHVMPVPMLIAVFAALVALTVLTVYLGTQYRLGAWEIYVSLGIATLKALLVATFFMHLRYDKPLNTLLFAFSFVFVALFLGATMFDAAAYNDEIRSLDEEQAAEALAAAGGGAAAPEEEQIQNIPEEEVLQTVMNTTGNVAVGETLFISKTCVACHRQIGENPPVGPKLDGIAKRMSREKIVESILHPSKEISKGYDNWTVVTIEGKVFTGILVSDEGGTLSFRKADGSYETLTEDELDDMFKAEKSAMPEGLVKTATPDQLASLVTYLESL